MGVAKEKPPPCGRGFWDKVPGDDLLLHGWCHTTIGAAAFHFRVRDGIGWFHSAMVARDGVEGRAWARRLTWGGKQRGLGLLDVSQSPRRLEVIWSSRTDH